MSDGSVREGAPGPASPAGPPGQAAPAADPPGQAAAAADLRREQASAPWWDPPECPIAPWPPQRPARQDVATDAYKLGLAVLRCLTPGPGAASTRSAGRLAGTLDPAGADLVARALSADRGLRPTARDWHGYLSRAAEARQALAQPVTVSLGDLARPVVPALEAVHLESPGIPAVSVPDLPAMPHPHVLDLVEKLMPDRPAVVSLPRVDDVIAQSSRAVAGTVRDESDRYLATLRRAGLGGGNDQAHG